MRNESWWVIALVALLTILISFLIAGLSAVAADSGRTVQLENDLRAGALLHRAHREACLAAPAGNVSRCLTLADGEWRKAQALAQARYTGTPAAWKAAEEEIRRIDARSKGSEQP